MWRNLGLGSQLQQEEEQEEEVIQQAELHRSTGVQTAIIGELRVSWQELR